MLVAMAIIGKRRSKMRKARSKYKVFKIRRISIFQGSWEVRTVNEVQSRWLPYRDHKDAIARRDKLNGES